jgi:hypothetical protein
MRRATTKAALNGRQEPQRTHLRWLQQKAAHEWREAQRRVERRLPAVADIASARTRVSRLRTMEVSPSLRNMAPAAGRFAQISPPSDDVGLPVYFE